MIAIQYFLDRGDIVRRRSGPVKEKNGNCAAGFRWALGRGGVRAVGNRAAFVNADPAADKSPRNDHKGGNDKNARHS